MNILVKRLFAFIIDLLILGCLIFILKQFVTIRANSLEYAALFLPLFFRDFTFKGASIGKKIIGIRVYNKDWETPKFSLLLKRTFILMFLNFDAIFLKGDVVGDGVIDTVNTEYKKLGTRVVETKVFDRFSAEAKSLDGNFAENMNKLYDDYMKSIYPQNDA